ncbi:ABC transporter ATP-binding protein [Corynebacterium sp. Q4381]|uniref:ABC transporter ATP-binding protein n=1 Tax=Corynebacterium sp. Marseille-Q4381 TaxID=3121597 RepID=UPI002FE5D7AD
MIEIDVSTKVRGFELHVDTTLPSSGIVGIVGPNGSGKSTLLRSMAGVHDFTGSILFDGTSLTSLPRKQRVRTLAYVAQSHGTLPDLTVRELVELGQTAGHGIFWNESHADADVIEEALIHSDLVELADRPLRTLSGGQVQRAMTARALAQDSEYLLLDEPTNHLDLHHQYRLMDMLEHVVTDHGTTVIVALHDLALAARYCTTVLVLDDGHVAALGAPSEELTPALLRATFGVDATLSAVSGEPSLVVHGPVTAR